ncbi:MAG: GGDEF and EAL domain-containing protein [Xanthobacteraceae bacterium]
MSKPGKKFPSLSVPFARELTDTLVIFSICMVAYKVLADWGGMAALDFLLGTHSGRPSFLYFFGIALVLFSFRRMGDQRSERTKRLAAELNAQTATMRDPLTQLPNRRQFQADVSAALKDADNKMSVLLLGLDQFKKLNEVYGHLGCDEALLQIGARIRERAAPGDIFARIGDDEFALCLVRGDPDYARRVACTLVEAVRQPVQIGIEAHGVGASVGIAQTGRGHATVDELLRCAHVALSRARSQHIEYCFFDPKMDAHIRERSLLEKDLRMAVGGHALRPYYQPIVDLKTRRIVSFESLARWHNPVTGLILPDTFIPLAEEIGILDIISGQLFGDACRHAVTWPEDISLTFNFSPSQFSDRSFADAILTVLHETGFPAPRLEVEITESALVEDLEATRHAIQTLRNAGVRIVIDDFGTGYSSLYHLYELRFDKLKIDKRFIQELVTTGESAVFIRAMVGLSRGLNLAVTAEGVETEAQAAAALEHGVDQGQGYLFGKAIPADQVLPLLAAPNELAA